MNDTPHPEPKPHGDPGSLTAILRQALFSRLTRRMLFVLACLATLLALFYAIENWRGKRAWEKCRRELEAKGEVLDWSALIPPPVPDDQNIFKAPRMTEWFVKGPWTEQRFGASSKSGKTNSPFSLAPHQAAKGSSVLVAEVNVIAPNAPLPAGKADALLTFGAPAAREEAAKILKEKLGPCVEGATAIVIVARPLDQIETACFVVQAETPPSAKDLGEFLYADASYLQIAPHGSNRFHVWLKNSVYTADEYLKLSQPAVPDLELTRQALERPYARMESDYQRPFEHPVPNFVRLRTVAQMLAQRAQCYLLLGQPEAAWRELSQVRHLCHMLEAKPASNCPTLVEAMINVAISGLYSQVIAEGLRLNAWREPELAAIQNQVAQVNLPPLVRAGFNAERAAVCRTFETCSPAELANLFSAGRGKQGLFAKLQDPTYLFLAFAPRGWLYQNMCTDALGDQVIRSIFDQAHNQILPRKANDIQADLKAAVGSCPPYTWIARMAIPNFVKASQTVARNQTMANQAYIACGLERFRLAHGQYPDTLEALVPQFADRIPHDLIGGQPLKYHRTAGDRFVLYSVGWNEKDDGGIAGNTNADGDWVWQ